jgi:hypothetical protein
MSLVGCSPRTLKRGPDGAPIVFPEALEVAVVNSCPEALVACVRLKARGRATAVVLRPTMALATTRRAWGVGEGLGARRAPGVCLTAPTPGRSPNRPGS